MRRSESDREAARDGEIRLFWIVLWAVSVAFALCVYRPNWEGLEKRRAQKRHLLKDIEQLAGDNGRLKTSVDALERGDRETWEIVLQKRGWGRKGEVRRGGRRDG